MGWGVGIFVWITMVLGMLLAMWVIGNVVHTTVQTGPVDHCEYEGNCR
jgi:hypothetical protein